MRRRQYRSIRYGEDVEVRRSPAGRGMQEEMRYEEPGGGRGSRQKEGGGDDRL